MTLRRIKRRHSERLGFYIFISPWILGFLAFTLIPMACSLYFAFHEVSVISLSTIGPKFIGWRNFRAAFQDPLFVGAIGNTFILAFARTLITTVLAFIMAEFVNRKFRCNYLVRTLIYLPAIIPGIAGALVWAQLFSSDASLLNNILGLFGIPPFDWLSVKHARFSIILMGVWTGIGPTMILIIAALQNVSKDLLEAAELDGAGRFMRLLIIVLPSISPTMLYQVITALIGGLQTYTEIKVLLGYGTESTITMTLSIVMNAFSNIGTKTMGYACAEAWILFVIVMAFTVVFFIVSKKFVYYESGKDA